MLTAVQRALEQRDRTVGHGDRVTALAEPVAVHLGWSAERLAALRLGGPLHDVGKIAVAPEILRKPGPLSAPELAQIRLHPAAGASLVRPIRSLRAALPFVLHHHERWDGDGYPAGIAGSAIPVEARLLAVADAYDAMTSPRPYRAALSPALALDELGRCAGTQFDPRIAAAFLGVWAELALEAVV